MQSDSGRYINSVSDLYGDDEIEFLLDDIRELEPISCRPDEIHDCEQQRAGSRTSAAEPHHRRISGGPIHQQATGVKTSQSAGTLDTSSQHRHSLLLHQHQNNTTNSSSANLLPHTAANSTTPGGGPPTTTGTGGGNESPIGTVHSWDSHSHYRRRSLSPDLSLYSGVIVYCDHRQLGTPTGVLRLLLIVTTVACLTCLCTAGTIKVGLFMLPLVGRIRLMLFVTIVSVMLTSLLLFLDISHMVYLFPFNWSKVNAYLYLGLSLLFLVSSSLLIHMVLFADAFAWVPKWTQHQIIITGCLGYICFVHALLIAVIQKCAGGAYEPVPRTGDGCDLMDDADAMHLHSTGGGNTLTVPDHHHPHINYKPIINYQMVPSTSGGGGATSGGSAHLHHNYLDENGAVAVQVQTPAGPSKAPASHRL